MKWIRWASVGGCMAWLAAAATAADGSSLNPTAVAAGPACQPPVLVGPSWAPPGCPAPPLAPPPTTNPGATTNPNPENPNPANPNPANPANPTNPSADNNNSSLPNESQAQAPEAGTQASASVAPAMFGDLIGVRGRRVVIVPNAATPNAGVLPARNTIAIVAPQPLHASYNITEQESPRPQNRAYVSYTYYENVDRLFPSDLVGKSNLDRETLGLEQTFDDGNDSIGLRLPFLQLTGSKIVDDNQVGDLSLIYKHAFVNDTTTGNLLSGGMVLTLPTGQGLAVAGESTIRSTIFQPFAGFIVNDGDLFFEGFTSIAVPTDFRDVVLAFNSVAVGYYMYRDPCRDSWVQAVSPQLELHLNTPLNHRGLSSTPVNYDDSLDLTGGAHILFHSADFGAAVGTPLTGPKPYDFEANATLTFRW